MPKIPLQIALKDCLSPYVLGIAILPVCLSYLLWGGLFFIYWRDLFDYFIVFFTLNFDPNGWFAWLQTFTDWLISGALFLLLALFCWGIAFCSNLIICSIVSPFVIDYVAQKHFAINDISHLPHTAPSINSSIEAKGVLRGLLFWGVYALKVLLENLKILALYVLFVLVCIPLYFIPFVGWLIFFIPSFWLFYSQLNLDVASILWSDKEARKHTLSPYKKQIFSAVLPLYLVGLVPFLGFFIPVFSYVVFAHLFLSIKLKKTNIY